MPAMTLGTPSIECTYNWLGSPNSNFASLIYVSPRWQGGFYSFQQWRINDLPHGEYVSAKLSLVKALDSWSTRLRIAINHDGNDWVETECTYNERKSGTAWLGGATGGYSTSDADINNPVFNVSQFWVKDTRYDFDFDAAGVQAVEDWAKGDRPNQGFVLWNDISSWVYFWSTEYSVQTELPSFTVVYNETTIAGSASTWDVAAVVSGVNADSNYGSTSYTYVGKGATIGRTLLRFDETEIPTGVDITGFDLFFHQRTGTGVTKTASVYRVLPANVDWVEGTGNGTGSQAGSVCWNQERFGTSSWAGGSNGCYSASDVDLSAVGTFSIPGTAAAAHIQIPIDPSVATAWRDGTYANAGLLLKADDEVTVNSPQFDSDNHANRPYATITYNTAIITDPTGLEATYMRVDHFNDNAGGFNYIAFANNNSTSSYDRTLVRIKNTEDIPDGDLQTASLWIYRLTHGSASLNPGIMWMHAVKGSTNSAWGEGDKLLVPATAGEAAWDSPDNTNPWEGSDGASTPGTDYDSTPLDTWAYPENSAGGNTGWHGFFLGSDIVKAWRDGTRPNGGVVIFGDEQVGGAYSEWWFGGSTDYPDTPMYVTISYTPAEIVGGQFFFMGGF